MILTLEINPEKSVRDVELFSLVSKKLAEAAYDYLMTHDGSNVNVESETSETSHEVVIEPVQEEKKVEKKPRIRKKKEEDVKESVEAPAEDVQSDLPFDVEEPAEEKKEAAAEPKEPTMSTVEWSQVNHEIRTKLHLDAGMEHANLRNLFSAWLMDSCELAFGVRNPSKLDDVQRYKFAEWVKTVRLNENYVPESTDEDKLPFVSPAPIKK